MNFRNLYKFSVIVSISIFLSACGSTSEKKISIPKHKIKKQTTPAKENKKTFSVPVKKTNKTKKEIIKPKKQQEVLKKDNKIIIGEIEYAYIPSANIRLKARIDTGATTTSINALNIKKVMRDGKAWVKFDLVDENKKRHPKSFPLYETISIKRHGTDDQKRYVIKMRINIAHSSQLIRVSLTDRSKFTFPVLLGRNFLNGVALVDVSKKFTQEPIKVKN